MKGIRVTAVDLETGQSSEVTLQPGNYTLVAAHPCYLARTDHHANGTSVLTLKGRDEALMVTHDVEATYGGTE